MTKDDIVMCINQNGLSHRSEELETLIALSVRIKTYPAQEDSLPVGVSKFGGHPDLPPNLEWPERDGRPLSLIAQLNLREIAVSALISFPATQLFLLEVEPELAGLPLLPTFGVLYFFYDAKQQPWGDKLEHRQAWQVLYSPNADNLSRAISPSAFPADNFLPTCRLEFAQDAVLPDDEALNVKRLHLSREEEDSYWKLTREDYTWSKTSHRVLGYPQVIQTQMEDDCSLLVHGLAGNEAEVELHKEEEENWRLLFQVDSDDNAEMSWGDAGRLYFWIRNADLQARVFDYVWMVLQCT